MSDIRRVDSPTFTPSAAQNEARWSAAKSKKAALLRSSDWSQLKDVYAQLTPEQRLNWDVYRRRLRAIKSENFATPEQYEAALTALNFHAPGEDVPHSNVPEVAEPPAEDGVALSGPEAVTELIQLSSQALSRACGIINPLTFNERASQAMDAFVELTTQRELNRGKYPILDAIAEATHRSMTEVVNETLQRYQLWLTSSATLDALAELAMMQVSQDDVTTEQNKELIAALDAQIVSLIESAKASNGH